MLVVGLTGGIGSGKTTAAEFFADKNVPVIDADEITHQLSQPDGAAYPKLKAWFGESAFTESGQLDRGKLRQIAFTQPNILERLEQLFHPLVRVAIQRQIKILAEENHKYIIVVIPLLIEAGMQDLVDRILVIDTTQTKQLERVTKRDDADFSSIKRILAKQINQQERLSYADDIIENNDDITSLKQQVEKLDQRYRMLAGTD